MSTLLRSGLAGMLLVAMTVGTASAQCDTCAQPTVAYQPVVAQPTVAYRPYNGWYPGKLLDQWRLRRAGVGTTATAYSATYAPSYTAAYAPAYTASYAPTYTASYAPVSYTASYAPTYTAAYRPYVTSYAPLSSAVATGCSTCTQTVARPVLMRPVVAPACDVCSYSSPCDYGGCSTCSSGVSQAVYSDNSSGCSSCAAGGTVTTVAPQSNPTQPSVGPATTQPSFAPAPEPAPPQSRYQGNRPIQGGENPASPDVTPDPLDEFDPGPENPEADSSTYFYNAPQLLDPRNNTAVRTYKSRQPTVDVHTAIYQRSASRPVQPRVSQTSGTRARTQAEIDAEGWSSVPSGR